jgi:hypothetical protein
MFHCSTCGAGLPSRCRCSATKAAPASGTIQTYTVTEADCTHCDGRLVLTKGLGGSYWEHKFGVGIPATACRRR